MTRKSIVILTLLLGLTTSFAQASDVTILHGIDGTDLGLDQSLLVDVSVDALGCVLGNVPFLASATLTDVPPGSYTAQVHLADGTGTCTGAVAISTGLDVNLLENSSVIAQLTDDFSITATKFVNDTRPANGSGRVVVRHTADAPAVDVWVLPQGGAPFILFSNLAEGDAGKADVGAGDYSVALTAAGTHPTSTADFAFGPVPLTLTGDIETIVYAVGSLNTGSFTVLVQEIEL